MDTKRVTSSEHYVVESNADCNRAFYFVIKALTSVITKPGRN